VNLSDPNPNSAAAGARLWTAPDVGAGVPTQKMATVGGLADLQAEAHKEAFEQGLAEGREAGRAEVRAQVERLAGMFYDLAKPFEVLDAEVERELLTLAMALARQIVRRELKADPTQIIGIIREAIAALPVAVRDVRVHLHPEDAAVVRQHLAPTESERAWAIVEDPVMARGGCQITTATSRIDSRLETRLGAILSELLGTDVPVAPGVVGPRVEPYVASLGPGEVVMLENLRFEPGETTDNPAFATNLCELADAYVNEAFGASHRAHASIVGPPRVLPSAGGLLLFREVDTLSRLLEGGEHPFVAVLGGAKVSDKLGVIDALLQRCDAILVGGAMMFTFLLAQGHAVGDSLVEPEMVDECRRLLETGRVRIPTDVVVAREFLTDVGHCCFRDPAIGAPGGPEVEDDSLPMRIGHFHGRASVHSAQAELERIVQAFIIGRSFRTIGFGQRMGFVISRKPHVAQACVGIVRVPPEVSHFEPQRFSAHRIFIRILLSGQHESDGVLPDRFIRVLALLGNFTQVQGRFDIGQKAKPFIQVFHGLIGLVQVPFDLSAQNVEIHREFSAAGLPIFKRHLR